jgi:aminopeptidase-like protein
MRHLKIIKDLLHLNRHHISPDMDLAINKLCDAYGGKMEEYIDDPNLSWRIPPGYKVIKAELKDSKGKLICSHENNPMHLWSYSPSFSGVVSYSDLKKRILVDFERPEAIVFHFRNQYRFWNSRWGFSLNFKQYSMLDQNEKYHVEIKTEFYDSALKQFLLNDPSEKNNLILVAHIDHYHQLNDGLGSAIVNNEIVSELKDKLQNINICSLNSVEILGSVYFLKHHKLNFSNTIGAICTNGLTLDANFIFQLSGKKNSVTNKLISLYHLFHLPKSSLQQFREGWGNDEIAFEVPGVSIPCVSVHRGPFSNYHTHLDDFSLFHEKSFNESKNLIKNIILDLDKNYTVEVKNWSGLISLANPSVDLYIEPRTVYNVKEDTNLEEFSFFKDLLPIEKKYLKVNEKNIIRFSNKFQSYLSHNTKSTIIDLAYEFSLPVTFVEKYFKSLEDKGFVSLIYKN